MLREISGHEYENKTNTLFDEFITHVMRSITDVKFVRVFQKSVDSHVFVTSVKNSHGYFTGVTNTFEFFTLVTLSFELHIRTNI